MDESAFSRSVVARGKVSVSMFSFCGSHKQLEASTTVGAVSKLKAAQFGKRNFCAKHDIKDDLTLGLGLHGGVAHQKRKTEECLSWHVLGSHSAEHY